MSPQDDNRDRIVISCLDPDWMERVRSGLREGREVGLTNFRYISDGAFCEMAAAAHAMALTVDFQKRSAEFRKKIPGCSSD